MKIKQENVAQTLMDTANVCQKMNVPLRCLYVKLSDDAGDPVLSPHDHTVIDYMEGCFKTHQIDAMGYGTDDGDLFFLARGFTKKIVTDVIEKFPKQILIDPNTNIFLYELQVDAHQLVDICTDKINRDTAKERARQRAMEDAKIQAHKDVHKNIQEDIIFNAGLLASFDARRAERFIPGILIVEDDPFSQRIISNTLRDGAEIAVASSGRQALQVMMKVVPDMIFLDIGLPDVTGLEILDEIFRIDPKAYVVMLSGNGSRDNVVGAMGKGAKGFIGKPFTVDKLIQAVSKCPFIQEKRDKKREQHG
jgi:CheY-like chemotaxis protein